jgi:hypothetical protein
MANKDQDIDHLFEDSASDPILSAARKVQSKHSKRGRQHGDWGYINSVRWFTTAREALRGHECGALALVVYLEREFGMGNCTVKVTNQALAGWGISPDQKIRTLRTLERAGLVSIVWGDRSSPSVTIRRRRPKNLPRGRGR